MASPRILTADRGDSGRRLDLVVRRHLTDIDAATRTRVQVWIEDGKVSVNGAIVRRVAARAALGDVVTVVLPEVPGCRVLTAEAVRLDVLYEDDYLLALDKPAGVVVHPGYRNTEGTVLNALLWHAREWPAPQRPSIVGRLDKLTSGIVVVAKTAAVHAAFQRTMASSDTEKDYLALVYGRVKEARGHIDLRLWRNPTDRRRVVASARVGAPSLTRFERLARVAAPRTGLALVRCRLATGRMHQIRVHMAARGWPIVGDRVYGEPRWSQVVDSALAAALRTFPRQALHAWRLVCAHPVTREPLFLEAPLPRDFKGLLAAANIFAGVEALQQRITNRDRC
jgi:23S rRNA pseudouridine1911/1915/1917 synthase